MKKSLLIFIITFACLSDLVVLTIAGTHSFGIYKIFLLLVTSFILQDSFKWFRNTIVVLILASSFISLSMFVSDADPQNVQELFSNKIFVPAAFPFYIAMSLVLVLCYVFLR